MTNKCLDFSLPLEKRIKTLEELSSRELDETIELLCSAYIIHPVKIYLEFIYVLIQYDKLDIYRRIRIAENCDSYAIILFILHRITDTQQRIHLIESCSNPFLKIQSYFVLFHHTNEIETQIQIMKNITNIYYDLYSYDLCVKYLNWFGDQLDKDLEHKHLSNIADFVLIFSQKPSLDNKLKTIAKKARTHLFKDSNLSFQDNRENVHLLNPTEQLTFDNPKVNQSVIIDFIQQNDYNLELFKKRILNDNTDLGNGMTLKTVIESIWSTLTDDLRHLLFQDFENDIDTDNEWSCTSGYYHRMLNIYQAISTKNIFQTNESKEFSDYIKSRINFYLSHHEDEKALEQIIYSQDEKRINYLTFKITHYPKLITEVKEKYPNLSQDEFDHYFNAAIRSYENSL